MAQLTHQKNQLKDTIDVEETEGMLLIFMFHVPISCKFPFTVWLILEMIILDVGDPLTAEELEEKEKLLEEVSGFVL